MLDRLPFVPPMIPTAVGRPPVGPEWWHEAKLDGFRAQIHVDRGDAVLFTRNGRDATKRFRRALTPLLDLRRRAVIDAELVACSDDGQPDFHALLRFGARSPVGLCLWCFDMMRLDGADLRRRPRIERQTRLAEVLADVDDQGVQLSAAFEDGQKLIEAAERLGYEGVVSKRVDSPYVSGRSLDWLKTKTRSWRAANKSRYELFNRLPPRFRVERRQPPSPRPAESAKLACQRLRRGERDELFPLDSGGVVDPAWSTHV